MGFSCGIVGLPNVGKSTIFSALSSAKAEVANYPFCTIEPNQGIVFVPDPRLKAITQFIKPQKIIPAQIQFWDIAGLVKGASKGEGLGNQFLSHIRQTDAIIHVVRCFEDSNITHVSGKVDPVSDIETIETELMLADLDSLSKKYNHLEKTAKSGDKEAAAQFPVVKIVKEGLEKGIPSRKTLANLDENSLKQIQSFHLLTSKKVLYAANLDEDNIANPEANPHYQRVLEYAKKEGSEVVPICGKIESELAEMNEEERADFLKELGIAESGLHILIRKGYYLLGLQTYFTAGEKEVRAWTILKLSLIHI